MQLILSLRRVLKRSPWSLATGEHRRPQVVPEQAVQDDQQHLPRLPQSAGTIVGGETRQTSVDRLALSRETSKRRGCNQHSSRRFSNLSVIVPQE